jgi:hypothetical protein
VHGVFQGVAPQPIEAIVLEGIYPTMRELTVIEGALAGFGTLGILLPIGNAMTASIAIRIYVDGYPKQMIGKLTPTDRIRVT